MAETTIVLPPRVGGLTRFWRKVALLRESKVGMVGAALPRTIAPAST